MHMRRDLPSVPCDPKEPEKAVPQIKKSKKDKYESRNSLKSQNQPAVNPAMEFKDKKEDWNADIGEEQKDNSMFDPGRFKTILKKDFSSSFSMSSRERKFSPGAIEQLRMSSTQHNASVTKMRGIFRANNNFETQPVPEISTHSARK